MILSDEDKAKLRKDFNELMHRELLTQEGVDKFLEKIAQTAVNNYEDKLAFDLMETKSRRELRLKIEEEES